MGQPGPDRPGRKRLAWLKARRRTLCRVAFEMSKDDVLSELEAISREISALERVLVPVKEVLDAGVLPVRPKVKAVRPGAPGRGAE